MDETADDDEVTQEDLDHEMDAVACCVAYVDDRRIVGELAHAVKWLAPPAE